MGLYFLHDNQVNRYWSLLKVRNALKKLRSLCWSLDEGEIVFRHYSTS